MRGVTEDDQGPAELLDVLWARLGPDVAGEAAAPRRREALRILGTRRARRRRAAEQLDPELATLFGPIAEGDPMAIAMVDLVGSTHYLKRTEPVDLERLVDALFTAGQAATAGHAAHVVKYVGDGLFLSGRDVGEVADVALDVLARLEE